MIPLLLAMILMDYPVLSDENSPTDYKIINNTHFISSQLEEPSLVITTDGGSQFAFARFSWKDIRVIDGFTETFNHYSDYKKSQKKQQYFILTSVYGVSYGSLPNFVSNKVNMILIKERKSP